MGTKIQVESCDKKVIKPWMRRVFTENYYCYLCSKHGKNSGKLCETREKDYFEKEHINLVKMNILPYRVFFLLLFEQPSYFVVTGRPLISRSRDTNIFDVIKTKILYNYISTIFVWFQNKYYLRALFYAHD